MTVNQAIEILQEFANEMGCGELTLCMEYEFEQCSEIHGFKIDTNYSGRDPARIVIAS